MLAKQIGLSREGWSHLRGTIDRRVGLDDAGLTLMELVVTMALTTILSAASVVMFLNSGKAADIDLSSSQTSAAARITLDSWSTLLQEGTLPTSASPLNPVANPPGFVGQMITAMSPTSILFYSNINNRPLSSSTVTPATLVRLEWRPAGQPICIVTAPFSCAVASSVTCSSTPSTGCLVETRYSTADSTTSTGSRILLANVTPGASGAAGGCGDASTIPTTRLFTACGAGTTLSGACASSPCVDTSADPSLLTTTNLNGSNSLPTAGAIVIAFSVVSSVDSSGTVHSQSYSSSAALTGLTTTLVS